MPNTRLIVWLIVCSTLGDRQLAAATGVTVSDIKRFRAVIRALEAFHMDVLALADGDLEVIFGQGQPAFRQGARIYASGMGAEPSRNNTTPWSERGAFNATFRTLQAAVPISGGAPGYLGKLAARRRRQETSVGGSAPLVGTFRYTTDIVLPDGICLRFELEVCRFSRSLKRYRIVRISKD